MGASILLDTPIIPLFASIFTWFKQDSI